MLRHMTEQTRTLDTIVAFARANPLGVVATVAPDGAPEAALIDLITHANGTITFLAHRSARKLVNLASEGRVAIVVGTEGPVTVQIEGYARVVEGEERALWAGRTADVQPAAPVDREDFALIVVAPVWLRYYDGATRPPLIDEMRVSV